MTITNRVSLKSVMAGNTPIADVPDAPTIGVATAGVESATVTYTAAATGGTATTFTATSSPGSITGTGSSPITVSGLTAGTAYTFTVRGSNSTGTSPASAATSAVTPIVATSYESIATVSVGAGGASDITFSSIPSTYTHLQIRFIARTNNNSTTDGLRIYFNSDGSYSYSSHTLSGNGSSASATKLSGIDAAYGFLGNTAAANANASVFGVGVIDILEYKNTNIRKTTRIIAGSENNGNGTVGLNSTNWRQTDPITTILVAPQNGSSFSQYTHFALYGIKGA